MRIAILGNSGSGKSTLARCLAEHTSSPSLDLDTVVWEAGRIAVSRPADAAERDVLAFCESHPCWIVEGCYARLISIVLAYAPRLLFLTVGEEACLANCRARPWEQHKYASPEEQDRHLAFLLSWVSDYYTRDGEMSLAAHVACFRAYDGPKVEITSPPVLEPPSEEVLSWAS
jgi:adenylate kinase family enzyme